MGTGWQTRFNGRSQPLSIALQAYPVFSPLHFLEASAERSSLRGTAGLPPGPSASKSLRAGPCSPVQGLRQVGTVGGRCQHVPVNIHPAAVARVRCEGEVTGRWQRQREAPRGQSVLPCRAGREPPGFTKLSRGAGLAGRKRRSLWVAPAGTHRAGGGLPPGLSWGSLLPPARAPAMPGTEQHPSLQPGDSGRASRLTALRDWSHWPLTAGSRLMPSLGAVPQQPSPSPPGSPCLWDTASGRWAHWTAGGPEQAPGCRVGWWGTAGLGLLESPLGLGRGESESIQDVPDCSRWALLARYPLSVGLMVSSRSLWGGGQAPGLRPLALTAPGPPGKLFAIHGVP